METVGNSRVSRHSTLHGLAYALSEIPFLIVFGAGALLAFGVFKSDQPISLSLHDLGVGLGLAASFMVLSGYAFSLVLLVSLYSHRLSWVMRAAWNVSLFVVHVSVFVMLVGDGPMSAVDAGAVVLGIISVVLAEATASLVWGKFAGSDSLAKRAGE